jgi:hypothetical protein
MCPVKLLKSLRIRSFSTACVILLPGASADLSFLDLLDPLDLKLDSLNAKAMIFDVTVPLYTSAYGFNPALTTP